MRKIILVILALFFLTSCADKTVVNVNMPENPPDDAAMQPLTPPPSN